MMYEVYVFVCVDLDTAAVLVEEVRSETTNVLVDCGSV